MGKGGFPGGRFPGGGNMNQMIKQAQKMQEQMQKAQDEIEVAEFEAVSGKKTLLDLKISPEAVDPDDVEMLQDLVISAVNEAIKKADEAAVSSMTRLTGGINIPGLF